MNKPLFTFFILLGLIWSVSGCDPLAKLAKSDNIAEKDSAAVKFYKKGKYDQAAFLLEDLIGVYRGQARASEVYYMFAMAKYKMGNYISASFYLDDFGRQFPRDSRIENTKFLTALSFYNMTDPHFLDQVYTMKAIENFQSFIDAFPSSERIKEANVYMSELRERLARKDFKQADLYFNLGFFKASKTAFEQFINDFPDSDFREKASFMVFKSAAKVGDESITKKRIERYEEALEDYATFLEKFPSSKYLKEAQNILSSIDSSINRISKKVTK